MGGALPAATDLRCDRIKMLGMSNLKEISAALLAKVKELQETVGPELARIGELSVAVHKAAPRIAPTGSGSGMGYHSEWSNADLAPPPLAHSNTPEWGGINGISPGWQKRSPDEVKERIERLSGESIASLEKSTDSVLQQTKALQSEIVTEISGLHLQHGLEQEKKLLSELEKFVWGHSINEIIHANTPSQAVSRDSEAVYQGIKVPAHQYYLLSPVKRNPNAMRFEHSSKPLQDCFARLN